jgi:hypothetical protein
MDVTKAAAIIKDKIINLDIDRLNISAYNTRYLKHYQQNLNFYLDSYSQLLLKAVSKLDIPVNKAVFLDYGGGSGLLSYLAVAMGFNKVVYNDLYEISVHDVKVISQKLQLTIDEFIVGDIKQVTESLNKTKIHPDLICSFDVLEHIYDLNEWFMQLKGFQHAFKLFFITHANGRNPFINRRLKNMQIKAELHDRKREEGWKEIDLHTSFLNERKKIIAQHFSQLTEDDINKLATLTRGLKENDMKDEVSYYITHGEMKYNIAHPTNTCDPYTGNWTEKIIDTKSLCSFINSLGFTCNISNSFYPYSEKRILNVPKYLLNLIIRLMGRTNLFFSPAYTIEVEHK